MGQVTYREVPRKIYKLNLTQQETSNSAIKIA